VESGAEVDLRAKPALEEAVQLLDWAFDSWLNGETEAWPEGLPRPVAGPQTGSDHHVADELCLCATAYLLHHELSHLSLKHTAGDDPEKERDADYAAADWILNGVGEEDDRFKKRILGVALTLLVTVQNGIHSGHYGGQSHPRSFDRLIHTLDRHVRNQNHVVWFFAATMLKLHLDNTERCLLIPEGPFNSGRHCVDSYVEALSRDQEA
jgi:hypothetical protein